MISVLKFSKLHTSLSGFNKSAVLTHFFVCAWEIKSIHMSDQKIHVRQDFHDKKSA